MVNIQNEFNKFLEEEGVDVGMYYENVLNAKSLPFFERPNMFLESAFVWESTKEGAFYWGEINAKWLSRLLSIMAEEKLLWQVTNLN